MNAQEIISSGILELYCTGLTSAAETADVQRWAKQYPEVAAEIEAIQAGLEGYAQAHAVTPGSSVKEKVFAEITKSSAAPVINLQQRINAADNIRPVSSFWKLAAAASIILFIASIIFNYSIYNKYRSTSEQLASTQAQLQEEKRSVQDMDSAMGIIGRMDAMQVAAKSTDSTKDMGAKIYWIKNTNDVYIDPSNLPKAPEGKQYEFWAIVDGAAVNGGVISAEVNGKKVHVQKMKSFGKAQAFAVSLEDAGPAKTKPDKVMAVGSI